MLRTVTIHGFTPSSNIVAEKMHFNARLDLSNDKLTGVWNIGLGTQ